MSYDLYFWRYEDEAAHPPGKREHFVAHCHALAKGEAPQGIATLPQREVVESVVATLKAAGWSQDGIFFENTSGAVIELCADDHHASFSLRGPWQGNDANFLIDIMKDFDCPLFDPQVGERFSL